MFPKLRVVLVLLQYNVLPSLAHSRNSAIFRIPERAQKFQNFVVHKQTGDVYVSAVNGIYHLDKNLNQKHFESLEFLLLGFDITNAEYFLALDYERDRLIVCGSIPGISSCKSQTIRNHTNPTTESTDYSEYDIDDVSVEELRNSDPNSNIKVLFTSQGPSQTSVIYMGFSSEKSIPEISIRSLDPPDKFKLITHAKPVDDSMPKWYSYSINFVYGFSFEGFSYFLTTQKKNASEESPFISKLIRVCQANPNISSYVELECKVDNVKYELVQAAYVSKPVKIYSWDVGNLLFASFPQATPVGSQIPGNKSALCTFPLREINLLFEARRGSCNVNKSDGAGDFQLIQDSCRSKFTEYDLCNPWLPVAGENITCTTKITFPHRLTSIAVKPVANMTLVYVGTINGHLKTVDIMFAGVVAPGFIVTSGNEFQDKYMTIGSNNTEELREIAFDIEMEHIYVLTNEMIYKVSTSVNCSDYSTCKHCTKFAGHECVWCTFQNKCTQARNCIKDINSDDFMDTWYQIFFRESYKCDHIIGNDRELMSKYENIVELELRKSKSDIGLDSQDLQCSFQFQHEEIYITKAYPVKREMVLCPIPTTMEFQSNRHNKSITVKVRSRVDDDHNFVSISSRHLLFYDCKIYDSCGDCVKSPFPCLWSGTPFYNSQADCEAAAVDYIPELKNLNVENTLPSYFYPEVKSVENRLRIPNGKKEAIELELINYEKSVGPYLKCRYNIEGEFIYAKGVRKKNKVYCEETMFSYKSLLPTITVQIDLVVKTGFKDNEQFFLENPTNLQIVLYRCEMMADDCDKCLRVDQEQYNCVWCTCSEKGNEGHCRSVDECKSIGDGKCLFLVDIESCPTSFVLVWMFNIIFVLLVLVGVIAMQITFCQGRQKLFYGYGIVRRKLFMLGARSRSNNSTDNVDSQPLLELE